MLPKLIFTKERLSVYCFFIIILIAGFSVYRDFGVSTDEWMQRIIGQISLKYISNLIGWHSLFPGEAILNNPTDAFFAFQHDRDRTYGVVFELPAEFLIKLFNISDTREIFYFRHGLTFFCFFICLVFFYRILFLRFKNIWISILGCSLLLLSPRIFGDAFYNSKDLVFMCFVVISTYTMLRFVLQPRVGTMLWHALACALAIDTRFLGLFIPALTLAFLAYPVWLKRISLRQGIRWGLVFSCACFGLIIIFWPWLWSDPLANIYRLIEIFSNLRLNNVEKVDLRFIFMGDIISSAHTPWYYLPVWIGITTPIPFLVLFLSGVCVITWNSFKQSSNNIFQSSLIQDQLILTLFWLPALAAMILKPTFYSGWRHMYFIYPFLIYIATVGVQWLWQQCIGYSKLQRVSIALLAVMLTWNLTTLIHWHPYPYLYFNKFAGQWSMRYESDYWGLSYRNLIEKIILQSSTKRFSIYDFDESLYIVNFALLRDSQKLQFVTNRTETCSDYIVIGSRGPYKQYQEKSEFRLFHELRIDGQLVNAVFQRINPLLDRPAPLAGEKIEWSNPDMRCFLANGWSENTETWGVWNQGKKATLNLPVPSTPVKELILELRAFVDANHPIQNISIAVDGDTPRQYKLQSFDKNKIVLPLSDFSGKSLIELNFIIPEARSPKATGISEDTRELGVGLISATFR